MTMLSLKNQIAVVTGSSNGIGRSIALALAKAKVQLCLIARNAKRLEVVARTAAEDSPLVKCYYVDLTKDKEIKELKKKLDMDFDKIDMLIHSAGMISIGKLEFSSVADFDQQYKINVRAPFLLTQTLLPMLRTGKGQIVFINSSAGLKAGVNNGQYAATKSALKAIADSFRDELNVEEIRVLSVYPGRTATAMQEHVSKMEGREYHPDRLLQSEDVAASVVNTLRMPHTAEITDIHIRPFFKSY